MNCLIDRTQPALNNADAFVTSVLELNTVSRDELEKYAKLFAKEEQKRREQAAALKAADAKKPAPAAAAGTKH